MDTKQENVVPVLPEAAISNTVKQESIASSEVIATPVGIADPAIGQVNPNPVIPKNIVPVDIDTSAGANVIKPPVKTEMQKPVAQSIIKTSGTTTEEEMVIDATKAKVEVLDEYALTMEALAEKKQNKKNNIFIGIVFGIIILFIIFLKLIITVVGY